MLLVLLLLLQSAVIEGRVLNPDGTPAWGVRVAVRAAGDPSATGLENITQTDAEGRYRLEGLTPGRYYVVAGRVESLTYFPGLAVPDGATVHTITAATRLGGVAFKLLPTKESCIDCLVLSGRVKQPDNMNPQPTTVTVTNLFGRVVGAAPVAQDGTYKLKIQSAGLYRVTFAIPAGTIDRRLEIKDHSVELDVDLTPILVKR
jgi:hypothetical protein